MFMARDDGGKGYWGPSLPADRLVLRWWKPWAVEFAHDFRAAQTKACIKLTLASTKFLIMV